MSVVDAGKWYEQRGARFQQLFNGEFAEHYKVTTDNQNDSALVVKEYFEAVHNPKIFYGAQHPDNGLYTCRALIVRPLAPKGWEALARYSSKPEGQSEQEEEPNPLDRVTKISWTSEFYQEFTHKALKLRDANGAILEEDDDGIAMLTSALYPMEPLEIDRVAWNINFRKNFTDPPEWVKSFNNKLNELDFVVGNHTLEPRTCKMQSLHISEPQIENEITYVEVGGTIGYRSETWDSDRMNAGFYDIAGRRIEDNGTPPAPCVKAWPLTERGTKIENPTEGTVNFRNYQLYETADFNLLPF
jgi:hypothetical protein